jgi:hypothetical protein
MIPHAEFERAINQWKIRQQGGQVASQAEDAQSGGAVMAEMPTANAEPSTTTIEMSGEADDDMRRGDFDPE